MFERTSAIASGLAKGGRDGARGGRLLKLGEVTGWSLLQMSAFAGSETAFNQALEAALGGKLPAKGGRAEKIGGRSVFLIGPAQYLILGEKLSFTPDANLGAALDLSHARTRIFLEGAPAARILSQGAAIDFSDAAFPVGAFAQTGIHHTPVAIWRVGPERYELIALRTFALTLWDWLTDACLVHGYEVAA